MANDLDPRNDRASKKELLNRSVYYKGDMIINQGDEGYRGYYIERGRVEVFVNEDGHDLKVAELGAGDIFGEMALLNRQARSASVRAIHETVVSVIARDELERRISKINDKAIRALINVLAKRLQKTTKDQMEHYKSLFEIEDRVSSVIEHAKSAIEPEFQDDFTDEIEPILVQLQKTLDKYRK